jgi:hypothetical protein
MGSDPASFPYPMTVCLDIRVTDSQEGRPVRHYSIKIPAESPAILPGAIRTFTFTGVQFPCVRSAFVTATADCARSVPNNANTNPSLTIFVPTIGAIPWLWTSVRVGLRDSTGNIVWGPGALCPGATCEVEASIRNAGCAAAIASLTTLEVLDGAGNSIASLTKNIPSVAPGVTRLVGFVTTIPATVPGNSVTIRACADGNGVVTPQCNLQHRCAEVTLPLATAGVGPKLTFSAGRAVFPGEAVLLSWRIQNFCADLGKVTARILYQGNQLYKSTAIAVGLQDAEKGEDVVLNLTAAGAPNFYKIGTSTLTLEVTGTGTDPGPYTTTTTVTVTREPVSGTWAFTLPAPGTRVAWKAAYTVAGRLTNPTHATMTPASIVLDETSTAVGPIQLNASMPIGAIAPGAFDSEAWSRLQNWSWLFPGVWQASGAPQGDAFVYTVTFDMQDEFGNSYPAVTSTSLTVGVAVSTAKLALAATAAAMFDIGVTLTALAFLALAGYYTAIGAPALFAAAGIAYGVAAGAGAGALDPPVPDFDYRRLVSAGLPELPAELEAEPALASLVTVFALLERVNRVDEAMTGTEARLIAARIDRDADAIALQSAEYRDLCDRLLATASHVPLAVLEAVEAEPAQPVVRLPKSTRLRRAIREWASGGVPAKLRREALASGLSEAHLKDFEQALGTSDSVLRPIDVRLGDLSHAVAQFANAVQDDAEVVLHPPSENVG